MIPIIWFRDSVIKRRGSLRHVCFDDILVELKRAECNITYQAKYLVRKKVVTN